MSFTEQERSHKQKIRKLISAKKQTSWYKNITSLKAKSQVHWVILQSGRQDAVRPWRRASPAAVCGWGRGGGGAAAGKPARLGRRSVVAGGGSWAAVLLGAAPGGTTRSPAAPRGARPETSAPSPGSPPGRRLTDGQTQVRMLPHSLHPACSAVSGQTTKTLCYKHKVQFLSWPLEALV